MHLNYSWYYIPCFIYFGCQVSFINNEKEINKLMEALDNNDGA